MNYVTQTNESIKECLLKHDILIDFTDEKHHVSEEDVPFFEFMQACDMMAAYNHLAGECRNIIMEKLHYCVTHENPHFKVKITTKDMVDVKKLAELRPALYLEFRALPSDFITKRFSPSEVIAMMKEKNVSEDEIKQYATVTVKNIENRLTEEEKEQIIVKNEKSPSIIVTEVTE